METELVPISLCEDTIIIAKNRSIFRWTLDDDMTEPQLLFDHQATKTRIENDDKSSDDSDRDYPTAIGIRHDRVLVGCHSGKVFYDFYSSNASCQEYIHDPVIALDVSSADDPGHQKLLVVYPTKLVVVDLPSLDHIVRDAPEDDEMADARVIDQDYAVAVAYEENGVSQFRIILASGEITDRKFVGKGRYHPPLSENGSMLLENEMTTLIYYEHSHSSAGVLSARNEQGHEIFQGAVGNSSDNDDFGMACIGEHDEICYYGLSDHELCINCYDDGEQERRQFICWNGRSFKDIRAMICQHNLIALEVGFGVVVIPTKSLEIRKSGILLLDALDRCVRLKAKWEEIHETNYEREKRREWDKDEDFRVLKWEENLNATESYARYRRNRNRSERTKRRQLFR